MKNWKDTNKNCLSVVYKRRIREIIKVKIEKEGTFIKKSFKNEEIEVLKAGKRKEKLEEGVDMKELKALEEGFKREDI